MNFDPLEDAKRMQKFFNDYVQALESGREFVIECRIDTETWGRASQRRRCWYSDMDYRIKYKPVIGWVNEYQSNYGKLCTSPDEADKSSRANRVRRIKVQEIPEDD